MGADAMWPLQQAIHATLATDSTLAGLAPGGVHDHPPEGTAFPWVQIGVASTRDFSGKTFAGALHTVVVDVWSRGRGRREAKLIAARIHALLHGASLTVSGHVLVDLGFEGAEARTESDGLTTSARLRFRAITQET